MEITNIYTDCDSLLQKESISFTNRTFNFKPKDRNSTPINSKIFKINLDKIIDNCPMSNFDRMLYSIACENDTVADCLQRVVLYSKRKFLEGCSTFNKEKEIYCLIIFTNYQLKKEDNK